MIRHPLIGILLLCTACTSKQDVTSAQPLLDRIFEGNYELAAACAFDRIQRAYTLSPAVQYIPVPAGRYVEIQITASSAFTGTIYGAIARLEDISGTSYRATVRAAYTADGDVAVAAITGCAGS